MQLYIFDLANVFSGPDKHSVINGDLANRLSQVLIDLLANHVQVHETRFMSNPNLVGLKEHA